MSEPPARKESAPTRRSVSRKKLVLGLGVLGMSGVIGLCYVGWGSTDSHWRAPLEYPNRGEGKRYDPNEFSSAAVCGSCHQQHYAEWRESGMGRSSEVSQFLIDLYEASLDIRGAPVEDVEQCLHCHAPLAVMGEKPDLKLARELSQEGVNCDVCHTVSKAHANDAPGMLEWDPSGPKRGPLPGSEDPIEPGVPTATSTHHKTAYSALHQSSELCGACHMSLWPTNALPIDWTYAEWKRSPQAKEGMQCQDCHMPTYEGVAAPGAPRRTLHRHTFPGGGDTAFVQGTARLEMEVVPHFAGKEVVVTVENERAAHAFPTGNATAPVVMLEFQAKNKAGEVVFEGSREYRLTYVDSDGEVTSDPTTAIRMKSDTTLQPRAPRHEHFFVAEHYGATRFEAKLVYHRWSADVTEDHSRLVREFIGRYMQQGFRPHRAIARLADLRYDKLSRVRTFDPLVVAQVASP